MLRSNGAAITLRELFWERWAKVPRPYHFPSLRPPAARASPLVYLAYKLCLKLAAATALREPAQGQLLSLAPAFEGQSSIGKPDVPDPIDRTAPNTPAGRRRDRQVRRRLARRRYQRQQPVPSRIHRHDGRDASHDGRHAMDARVPGMQRELLRSREIESIF
jgi:hypothetical protein